MPAGLSWSIALDVCHLMSFCYIMHQAANTRQACALAGLFKVLDSCARKVWEFMKA